MTINDFRMGYFGLGGKNAIVTGGNSGLGQAFTVALAKAGANVFVPSIADDDGATAGMVAAENVRYEFMQADITTTGSPKRIVDACVDEFGAVDILVNSAGVCPLAEVLDFGREPWDATVHVNLTAAFEMSYEVAQRMVPRKSGKIINICSMFSFLGGRMSPAYSATKHGIAGLTKAYCDELAEHNIQVNGIAPGYYATAITANTRSNPESSRRVLDHIPADRWGEPIDLMGTVVFLA
ncbi:MAG: SDR family NAD(P)-dependent oxidoreductase, partial [Ilumatobacteraceae bacterium]